MRLNRLRQGTGLVWGRLIAAGLVLAVVAGLGLWAGSRASHITAVSAAPAILAAGASPNTVAPSQVLKAFGRLPLMFEPNVGQTDPQVKFVARGAGYGLFLTADEAVFSFARQASKTEVAKTAVWRMRLSGAAAHPSVSGEQPLPGRSNYFLGNDSSKWRQDVPQFARAAYKNVYPGVDLAYYGNQGELEYDFTVGPEADPNVVRLDFSGADQVALDSGDLKISTGNETLRLHAPRAYQMKGAAQEPVNAHFVLLSETEVGFEIGAYDRARALVIDPVLSYSTYLGGSGNESSPQIAVDAAFNFYLAGSTTSANFPSAGTPFQTTLAGTANVFIAKFDSTGSTLKYASYLGGNGTDTTAGVAVDAAANIYVAGTTTSTNFPVSSSAYQAKPTSGSGTHAFVTELSPGASTQLAYSSYLSGSRSDTASGLAIDSKGNVYVIGITNSADFPVVPSPGALQDMLLGPNAFFVSKILPSNTGVASLIYSTFFGGSFPSTATVTGGGIAVDNNSVGSNIFITGGTNYQYNGNANDFPIKNAGQGCLDTPGQNNENGNCSQTVTALDAFVAKINPLNSSGAQLVYSTYIGGTGDDVANGIQVDSAGNAYIAGYTTSTESPGIITQGFGSGPFQSTNKGNTDAFIAKITNPVAGSSTSNVVFSYFSYLGGSGTDVANALAIDTVQGAIVSGTTNSTDLPVTSNAVQSTLGGGTDAFLARLDTTGFTPTSTGTIVSYLGGTGDDRGTGIAVDSNAVIYVSGDTMSPNFPTKAPFQGFLNGAQDAFAAKLGPAVSLTVTPASQGSTVVNAGNQATFNYTIKNNGDTVAGVAFVDNLANSGVVANFVSATAAGGTCPTSPTNNTIICNIGVLNGGASTTVTIVLTPTTSGTLGNSGSVIVAGSTFTASASASLAVNSYTLAVAPATTTVAAGNPATFTPTLTPVGTNGTYSASISFGCPNGLPSGTSCTFSTTPVTLENQSPSSVTLTIDTTPRTTTTAGLGHQGLPFAMWFPVGGLAMFGVGLGGTWSRKHRVLGGVLLLVVVSLIAMQPACSHSSSTTLSSGTPAGTYDITVSATSGTYNQTQPIQLVVQ